MSAIAARNPKNEIENKGGHTDGRNCIVVEIMEEKNNE